MTNHRNQKENLLVLLIPSSTPLYNLPTNNLAQRQTYTERQRKTYTETHTERKTSCDDEGRDWSNAGTPRIASNHQKLRSKAGFFPRAFGGADTLTADF